MSFFREPRSLRIRIIHTPLAYSAGLAEQLRLHERVSTRTQHALEMDAPDEVLILQHSHVYTLGTRGTSDDFLVPANELEARGIEIAKIDRGGQVTYHGPGQIVLYIITNLGNRARSIRKFISLIEGCVIEYLSRRWDIEAAGRKGYPGVWVGDEKIAALGISIHNKTTMHGFALNLNPDLSFFENIIPCGITDKAVCSVESILKSRLNYQTGEPSTVAFNIAAEMNSIAEDFARIFGYKKLSLAHIDEL